MVAASTHEPARYLIAPRISPEKSERAVIVTAIIPTPPCSSSHVATGDLSAAITMRGPGNDDGGGIASIYLRRAGRSRYVYGHSSYV